MINRELTDFISNKLKIARKNLIEKDVIIHYILYYLMQDGMFAKNYAFKGGTCLIKCYLGYYRFSEDLDFTFINYKEFDGKTQGKIRELISKKISRLVRMIEEIAEKIKLDFKAEKGNRRYVEFGGGNTFVTFKIWYDSKELAKETFVKIQVNYRENFNYKMKELYANSILPKSLEKDFLFLFGKESEILLKPVKVKVYDPREILTEKVRAILTRRGVKARDFIDVFLILEKYRLDLYKFNKEIIEKIKFMLKFEKYQENIKNKVNELKEELILEEEKRLLLIPIDKDFPNFVKKFNTFLREIIKELNIP